MSALALPARTHLICAVSSLLSGGCSLLFAPPEPLFAEGQGPDLYFDFEGSEDKALRSKGQLDVELELSHEAFVQDGALDLGATELGHYALATPNYKSESSVFEVNRKCMQNGGVTLSAWLTVLDTQSFEGTPARIFTIESGRLDWNVSLGQRDVGASDSVNSVLRIGNEEIVGPAMPVGELVYVFATVDTVGNWRMQIDEVRADQGDSPLDVPDLFSSWNSAAALSMGAALTDDEDLPTERGWSGRIHHLELFCRSLSVEEQALLYQVTVP